MVVIAACAALVLLGIAVVVRWVHAPEAPPQGWLRHIRISLLAGLGAGVLAAGAGG
jgi:hypothetical protein